MKTILFLFNSSEYAVMPWLAGGYNCVSVDYDDTDHSRGHEGPQKNTEGHHRLSIDLSLPHATGAVQRAIARLGLQAPSLVISFAPCTNLAVCGAKHFAQKLIDDPVVRTQLYVWHDWRKGSVFLTS